MYKVGEDIANKELVSRLQKSIRKKARKRKGKRLWTKVVHQTGYPSGQHSHINLFNLTNNKEDTL